MDGEQVRHARPDLVIDRPPAEQRGADDIPPSLPVTRKRKGRKKRRASIWSSTLHQGGLASTAATSSSATGPRLPRSRSCDRNSLNGPTNLRSTHIEGLAPNGVASSSPPKNVEIHRMIREPGFPRPPAAEQTPRMTNENEPKAPDERTSSLTMDYNAVDLLRSLCHEQRGSLDSVLTLFATRQQDPDTQHEVNQIAQDLRTRIDDMERLGARILTPSSAMTSTPSLAKLPNNDSEVEEIPLVLQEYYDAAGWAGVLHERLIDLQYEHARAISERQRDVTVLGLLETESEKEYCREEDELKQKLRDARRQALDILDRCKGLGYSPKYPPRSSLFHSVASSVSRRSHSRDVSPLAGLRSAVHHLSLDPVEPVDEDTSPLSNWFGARVSRIKQWVSNVRMSRPGGAYNPYEHPADVALTTSVVSLPEYVRVDKRAAHIPPGDAAATDRVLDTDTVSTSHALLRRVQSFSSMRSTPVVQPLTGFRRQTAPRTRLSTKETWS